MSIETYVDSIMNIAEAEGVQLRIEEEFSSVVRIIDSNNDLSSKLTDELIPSAARQQIVETLLEGKAHQLTAQFISLVIGSGHARDLRAIAERVSSRVAHGAGREVAEVRTAVALSEDQQRRLAEALSKATGSQVNLKVIVDPTVVGGVIATVGDKVIDGSVRNRLDQLKSRL